MYTETNTFIFKNDQSRMNTSIVPFPFSLSLLSHVLLHLRGNISKEKELYLLHKNGCWTVEVKSEVQSHHS